MPVLRIGTRGSALALAQAHDVRRRLAAAHPELTPADAVEIVVIKTTGDRIQDRPLAEAGGKGLFTKEIEDALLDGGIDLAVHSMKDVPTVLPDGLEIAAILPREDPRDAWFSRSGAGLDGLPAGAVVGTSSLRRQAQVLTRRPELTVVTYRGNVETRLRKLAEGVVDATLLAMAGLNRLGHTDPPPTEKLAPEVMLPAVAQGAVGVEIRGADQRTRDFLQPLRCARSEICVAAERSLLAVLDGSCRTPIAALGVLNGDDALHFRAQVLSPHGRQQFSTSRNGPAVEASRLGADAGMELKAQLPPDFFAL